MAKYEFVEESLLNLQGNWTGVYKS